MKFATRYRAAVCMLVACAPVACKPAADTATKSCKLVAGLEFAGTVTDPTGRSQNTLMTLTRVSAVTNGGQVNFSGSVSGSDIWVTDSAKTFVQDGQTRMVTPTGDTLALSCDNATRTLSCQNAARARCLLSEVTH